MKLPKKLFKRTLFAALALLIAAAPCSLAEQASPFTLAEGISHTSDIKLYPTGRIGFITGDAFVYRRPTEFADKISIDAGMPVMVVGVAGQFFCVENADGDGAYIPMNNISPLMPANTDPFDSYDPKWEREECMLMLPRYMTLYQYARDDARCINLPEQMPCYVVGKYNGFYRVCNMDRSIYAYILPVDLTYCTMWAVGA